MPTIALFPATWNLAERLGLSRLPKLAGKISLFYSQATAVTDFNVTVPASCQVASRCGLTRLDGDSDDDVGVLKKSTY
jgi:hypothetical protein